LEVPNFPAVPVHDPELIMEPAIDGVTADHDPSAAVCSDRSAVGRFHSCRGGVALRTGFAASRCYSAFILHFRQPSSVGRGGLR